MVARPLFFVLALAAALSGCGASDDAASPGGDTGAGGDPAYTIAVVPKGLGHQFWLTVKQGAEAAGKEFNAKIIWNGPSKETEIAEQINIVEDMITRGVDAIVMAACDENALIAAAKLGLQQFDQLIAAERAVEEAHRKAQRAGWDKPPADPAP
ncbi:MAG: substrate-binding domain-containing protein [Proteobacteria bacterium]|nr:substrate-binding domain-containing protein [Pseudomonadota bacterium]